MTADTSAVVAALSAWHEHHDLAAEALRDITVLPSHALLESYAVLTRLPGGLAVSGPVAGDLLSRRFPEAPLTLAARARRQLVATLSLAGITGGATYDGLVGLEAAAADQALITLDRRAAATYQRLQVDVRLLAAG